MREGRRHLGARTGAAPPEATSDDSKITTRPPRSPVARYSPFASNSTALIRSSARGVRGAASWQDLAAPVQPPPCQCSGITPSAPLAPAKTDEQADNSNQGLRRTVCRLFCRVFLPKDLPESPVCVRHRWRCLHSKTSVFRAHGRQSTSRAATPAAYLELSGGDRPCSPLQHQRYAFLGAAAKFSVGHASFASLHFPGGRMRNIPGFTR